MFDQNIIFPGWTPLFQIVFHAVSANVVLLFLLRGLGQRSIAQTNTFDLILSVGIGAIFGGTLLNRDITMLETMLAIAVLIYIQRFVAWLRIKFPGFGRWISSKPQLLFSNGELHRDTLKKVQIKEDEIPGIIRQKGVSSLMDVESIWLEGNGNFSVVAKSKG